MDRTADLGAEDGVDELVLLDPREPVEAVGDDLGAEVVAAAGEILHLGAGAGQRLLDPVLELVGTWHRKIRLARCGGGTMGLTMVTLTDFAAEKVTLFLATQEAGDDAGLRVGVRGGGCSGFQYALALDERKEEDQVFEDHGIRLIVDPASLEYVDGSVVDYTESLMGAGFEVKNPNVVAACGCGSSFRVADEEASCG